MAFMRRILWFDKKGTKHVTWKSMGDDTTTVTPPVPTPGTLPTGTTQPATPPSFLSSIPTPALVAGGGIAAYLLFFRKKR